MSSKSICRLCDSSCEVDVAEFPAHLSVSNSDYISGGYNCSLLNRSLSKLRPENRVSNPIENGKESNWTSAIDDIQKRLTKVLKEHGPDSVGFYLGPDAFRRSSDWLSALSFAVSIGSKSIFTEQCLNDAARLQAIESVMGYATPLLSDVSRAHYIVMLGDDPQERGWGSLHSGMSFRDKITHSQKTKGTKLIVASPRKQSFSESANTHLFIRPGSEVYFLLGLLSTMVNSQWVDKQYIRDYTEGFEQLKPALSNWTTERCARLCGLEPAELSGIALKFSRAAMAVIHPSPGTFSGPHADLAAWAWMAIHMVTANALRPGGIFENQGAIDLQPLYAQLHSEMAPSTRIGAHPLLLMQAPATRLVDEITESGEGQIKALFVVGEPLESLPQPSRLSQAYRELDLLVHITTEDSQTSKQAHWVLPRTHGWEQSDIEVHRNTLLPYYAIGVAKALQEPAASAMSLADILSQLSKKIKKTKHASAWGWHLRMAARFIVRRDVSAWTTRLCNLVLEEPLTSGVNVLGEIDRSVWRPNDNILRFFPQPYPQLLEALSEPKATSDYPLWLCTDLDGLRCREQSNSATIFLTAHPHCGFSDGENVILKTAHGRVEAVLQHNENQDREAIICSAHRYPEILNVLSAGVNSMSGAVVLNGEPCRLELLTGA